MTATVHIAAAAQLTSSYMLGGANVHPYLIAHMSVWAHTNMRTPPTKRHLDRFSLFCKARGRRQTRVRCDVCGSSRHIALLGVLAMRRANLICRAICGKNK